MSNAEQGAPTVAAPAAQAKSPRKRGSKGNGAKAKEQSSTALTPFNRIEGLSALELPESNASPQLRAVAPNLDKAHVIEAVPGLALLQPTDVAVTFPGLAGFPLKVSKTGQIMGLMNIAEYARLKTGRAWSEQHQANIRKDENIVLNILPKKSKEDIALRKQLGKELDDWRKKYFTTAKPLLIAAASRTDAQVRNLKLRKVRGGYSMAAAVHISTASTDESAQMRKQIERLNRENEALKSVVPDAQVKKLLAHANQQDVAIDVEVTKTGDAPSAPVLMTLVEGTSKAKHVKPEPEPEEQGEDHSDEAVRGAFAAANQ